MSRASAVPEETYVERIVRYQVDPPSFVREVLHDEPTDYQERILYDCAVHDQVAVHTGHGVGKTKLASWIILWFLFCFYRPKVISTAPTKRQLKDQLWGYVHYNLSRADLSKVGITKIDEHLTRVALSEDVYATGETATDPKKIEGYHAPNILYLLDEAKGIPDEIFDAVQGALTSGEEIDGRSLQLVISTPGPNIGRHFEICTGRIPGWRVHNVNAEDSPFVSKSAIAKMRLLWGEDSFLYRTRVRGIFDSRAGDVVIPLELVEAAFANQQMPDRQFPELGVDVAHGGDDFTVIVTRIGNCVMSVLKFQKRDTEWTADTTMRIVRALCKRYNLNPDLPKDRKKIKVKVDSVGLGLGVVDKLRRNQYGVIAVNSSSKPFDEEQFRNRRSEMWVGFSIRLKEGRVDLSRIADRTRVEEIKQDLTAPSFKLDLHGRFQVEPKEQTKKRLHHSPDIADAILLAFAAPDRRVSGIAPVTIKGVPTKPLSREITREADIRAVSKVFSPVAIIGVRGRRR